MSGLSLSALLCRHDHSLAHTQCHRGALSLDRAVVIQPWQRRHGFVCADESGFCQR